MMPKNTKKKKKGLDLHEFLQKYDAGKQCRRALYHLYWFSGYMCPACGNKTGCELKSRPVYQYYKRHYQASLTAESTAFLDGLIVSGLWLNPAVSISTLSPAAGLIVRSTPRSSG